jgi:hypothetical protein
MKKAANSALAPKGLDREAEAKRLGGSPRDERRD